MKNFIKIRSLRSIILLMSILLYVSCAENDLIVKDSNKLLGTWRDTIQSPQLNQYEVWELTFKFDSTFSSKRSIYSTQNVLLNWIEQPGDCIIQNNQITFNSHQDIGWNNTIGGQPVTTTINRTLYSNCTYKFIGEILEIDYFTYPADAPVSTMKQYKKVQ